MTQTMALQVHSLLQQMVVVLVEHATETVQSVAVAVVAVQTALRQQQQA
jgi:hypothetical protein